MSMLAEPRRKANWVLNPKNTHWTADTSKFGLRLMEKMGWTEGKGLGANEQGNTGHIQVKVRSDNRGVGFKDRPEDELVHQSEFSDLLEQLASETPPLEGSGDETKSSGIVSLEQKSQMSRSRVHYRKFTRGKDLSRYSEKDLASILGKPAPLNSATDTVSKKEQNETSFQSDVSTIAGGNMFDYFRKKKSNIGLKDRAGDVDLLEDICANNGYHEENGTKDAVGKSSVSKKKKKSKSAAKDFEQSTLDTNLNDLEKTEVVPETRRGGKRKSKACEALQISGQDKELNKISSGNENALNRELSTSGPEDCTNNVSGSADGAETKKERKKRRKAEKALKNSEIQTIVEDATDCRNEKTNENPLLAEVHAVKEKKRRRKFESVLESSQDRKELEMTTDLVGNAAVKKSKKIANSSLKDGEQAESNDKYEERMERKQKHKKASEDKDNSGKNELEMVVRCDSADLGSVEKKKRKSKMSKKESDRSLGELKIEDNVESFVGIEKKKKRRANDDMNVIPDDGANEKKNLDGPIATAVHEPEFFCDARSKKAKKKRKLNETTQEPIDRLPVDSEVPEDSCNNEDSGFSVRKKIKKMRKASVKEEMLHSEKPDETTGSVNGGVEGNFEAKEDRQHKVGSRDPPSKEDHVEMTDAFKEEVECFAETKKKKKKKRMDRDAASSAEKVEHDILIKNNVLSEQNICLREQIQSAKNDVDSIDVKNLRPQVDVEKNTDRLESIFVDDVACAKLNVQEGVNDNDVNVTGKIDTGVVANTKMAVSNQVGEIGNKNTSAPSILELKNKASNLPENKVAVKKPVSIVEMNGNVYINGICNFDLSHPVINNVELKRIPTHMRDDVEYLPIPGANVDEFGYIGLPYSKKVCPK